MTPKPRPLFVKLDEADRRRLDQLAGDSAAAAGRPVSISEVIRQLVRDASRSGKPVRLQK